MQRTPWQDSPREPMEVIMRIAGRTTFVAPSGGGSGRPSALSDSDVCQAIAYARRHEDDLGADLLAAAALPAVADLSAIARMTLARAASLGLRPHKLRTARRALDVATLEVAVLDSIIELVHGYRLPHADGARIAHVRREDYVGLQRCFSAVVQTAAPTAARAAVRYLFDAG